MKNRILTALSSLAVFAILSCSGAEDKSLAENTKQLESMAEDISGSDDAAVAYLLDASCSGCIADFLRFASVVSCAQNLQKLYCVVNRNDADLLEYYCSETGVYDLPMLEIKIIQLEEQYPYSQEDGNVILLKFLTPAKRAVFAGDVLYQL